jgi:DNA-binding beta-propeller fold protein YncE
MFKFNRPAILGVIAAFCVALAQPATAQVYTYQQTLGVTGVTGTDNAHFNTPNAGSVDTVHGHFFVGDAVNQRVQVYDTTTLAVVATIGITGVTGSDNAHFNLPGGAGFDPTTDRLFVADSGNQRVQVYDAATFSYIATIGVTGVTGTDNAHFNTPTGAHVNSAAHQLYVADPDNSRVQVYDTVTLSYVATIGVAGVTGSDNAHFTDPADAEYNSATNQIMVADTGNQRIQFFNATTFAFAATLGRTGSSFSDNLDFVEPVSISFDPTTNLILVDDSGPNERVQIFDALTNAFVQTLGTTGSGGTGNSQFFAPIGIGVDPTHQRVLIGDQLNQRVQVFSTATTASHASVLPGSRAVQVGTPATIFATMINAGTTALDDCQISLPITAPAGLTLSYQATNAANEPVGTPNAPVTIAGNDGIQTFLVSLRGADAFVAPGMPLDFACTGAAPAEVITGVDTVDLVMSSTPIADIVALSAVLTNNGITELPVGGEGAFAVASVNIGATAPITVSVDTGAATLPISAVICQTNPSNGQCLAAPAGSVSLSFVGGSAPTFSVFLESSGAVPFDPANSRVFVRFEAATGELHGSTSVAIETTGAT